jgi:SulP family sulfate permease
MLTRIQQMRFNFAEFSGALADLGVLLPLVLALISINGVNAASAFFVIGLAYLVNAFVYGLPIPVQPLKSFSAAALALGLAVPVIVAGSWLMALVFLLLALTRTDRLLARLFPQPVVRGVQLGLGILLIRSALKLILGHDSAWQGDLFLFNVDIPWLFVITGGSLIILLMFLSIKRDWAALGVILFGIILAWLHNGIPDIQFSPMLPKAVSGLQADDFWIALGLLVLPQIPLSLANSVYATTDAAQKYFGDKAAHVSTSRLLTTMGISNVAAAVFGGVPVCHGSGGLTAHFRLGARSGGAPLMLGILFLSMGIFGGSTILPLFKLIPFQALGVLLAYVGIQHALLARDLRGWQAWITAASVAITAYLTSNLAIGFGVGVGIYFTFRGFATVQQRWTSQREISGR